MINLKGQSIAGKPDLCAPPRLAALAPQPAFG
jgi:hypothetical protein